MTRRVLIAAILLLLGAVVNVFVAWGCAAWIHERNALGECWLAAGSAGPNEPGLLIGVWSRFGSTRILCAQQGTPRPGATDSELMRWVDTRRLREIADRAAVTGPIPTWSTCQRLVAQARHTELVISLPLVEDARGFPLRSLRCSFNPIYAPSYTCRTVDGIALQPASRLAHRWLDPRILPVRPLWAGFAINTVFYAAIGGIFTGSLFALRHHVRRRKGLCPACAYPTSGSAVCSECGKVLAKAAVA